MTGRAAIGLPAREPSAIAGRSLVVGAVALVVLLRLASVPWTGAGLFVDEAQYWAWSTDLQWGYHSKPPGIAALVALSTALFGDGVVGVKALAMACWGLAALAAGGLAASIGGAVAGAWAVALFAATPLAGALGLTATTDALLLLAWATASWALWVAVTTGRWSAWAGFGLAVGLGLLGKYTMAALLPGALAWALWAGGRRVLRPALGALLLALLVLSPHLAWNAAQGWPTLGHTVDTTVQAAGRAGTSGIVRAVELLLAQALMFGPVALALAISTGLARRRGRWPGHDGPGPAPASRRAARPRLAAFVVATAGPLLLAGLAQALRGRIEINWIAPVHLTASVALGVVLARRWPRFGRGAGAGWALALGAQALAVAVLTLLPAAVSAVAPGYFLPRGLDAWARMRGWTPAFGALRVEATSAPGLVVVTNNRNVAAHAAYVWRDQQMRLAAFDADGRPDHHWERRCPWTRALARGDAALLLAEGPIPQPMHDAFDEVQAPRVVRVARARGGILELHLARARGFRLDGEGVGCR